MAGLLSLDSKMQGRVQLEILLVAGGWFVSVEFSLLFCHIHFEVSFLVPWL